MKDTLLAELRSKAAAIDAVPRSFETTEFEVREAPKGSDSPGGVRFYAAMYDKLSLDLGGFREKIAPGAFDAAIAEDDVRALVNHDRNLVIGRSAPAKGVRTATLSSDSTGLLVDVPELPNTQAARDLVENLKLGNVDQSSFGFRTVADSWATVDGEEIRTLVEARLFDVSVVTFPAYPDTVAEARDLAFALAEVRAGKVLSTKNAETLASVVEQLSALLKDAGQGSPFEENAAPDEESETREGDQDDGERDAARSAEVEIAAARLRLLELAPVTRHPLR